MEITNKFLVFNKQEWLNEPYFRWTEKQLDGADEKGFIGTKYGVDCYLSRPIKTRYMSEKNNKEERPISFHYTNEQMVKDLIAITPIERNDTVLDTGSGKNKVWFNNLNVKVKYECEIEDGVDFYEWEKRVDWVIGNPPFHESWKFTEKALEIAIKGIAWLVNNQALNSHFTPRRITLMAEKGFYLNHIRVVADKRWFGRYYYLIFTKKDKKFLSTEIKTY